MTIVLRTIAESAGNEGELIADVIGAVSDLVRAHPRWVNTGLRFIESFDQISLAQVRKTAKSTGVQPLRDAIMTLLCVEIEKILGPSKLLPKAPKPVRTKREPKPPRSLTRIPEIEKNIALGVELLALRAATPSNTRFGRELRARFDVDQKHASQAMRVARLYATRPDIYRAVSWRTLVDLASPKMSQAVRHAFETKVLAGQSVSAPEIRRARGPLKGGSPTRRPADRPSRMAA